MPLYEYKCPAGHRFDELVKHDQADRVHCPTCQKKAQRLVSLCKTDRRFAGSEAMSITEGCHPLEVQANRQLFGDTVNIDHKGDYSFNDRGQQRRYRKRKDAIRKAEAALKRNTKPLPRGVTLL